MESPDGTNGRAVRLAIIKLGTEATFGSNFPNEILFQIAHDPASSYGKRAPFIGRTPIQRRGSYTFFVLNVKKKKLLINLTI